VLASAIPERERPYMLRPHTIAEFFVQSARELEREREQGG